MGTYFHTDLEDFNPVAGAVARCLRSWGRFIYLGAIGAGDGSGLWGRVGGHHKTLGIFFGAIAGAGLNIRAVARVPGWRHDFATEYGSYVREALIRADARLG